MKRTWPMTRFCCCICGYGSLVKTNFKFDQQHNAYCVKNDHHLKVIKHNSQLEHICDKSPRIVRIMHENGKVEEMAIND